MLTATPQGRNGSATNQENPLDCRARPNLTRTDNDIVFGIVCILDCPTAVATLTDRDVLCRQCQDPCFARARAAAEETAAEGRRRGLLNPDLQDPVG
jgi:hypothetical protein